MNKFDELLVGITNASDVDALYDVLEKRGLVTFRGVRDGTELVALGRLLGAVHQHRDSDPSGITTIANRTDDAGRPLPTPALPLHTDSSGEPQPPLLLLVACTVPPRKGGESTFADAAAIVSELGQRSPEALQRLCAPDCAVFRSVSYRPDVDSRPGEPIHRPVLERISNTRLQVRYRPDPVGFSPEAQFALRAFRESMERHTFDLPLAKGDGYLVRNDRWLHGRRAAEGPRTTLRLLIYPPGVDSAGARPMRRGFIDPTSTIIARERAL
jgi:alpha-ketoglutarate-dependent taurine dioxygenase